MQLLRNTVLMTTCGPLDVTGPFEMAKIQQRALRCPSEAGINFLIHIKSHFIDFIIVSISKFETDHYKVDNRLIFQLTSF